MNNYIIKLEFMDRSVFTETVENLTVTLANAALYKDKEGMAEPGSPLGSSIYFLYQLLEQLGEKDAEEVLERASGFVKATTPDKGN